AGRSSLCRGKLPHQVIKACSQILNAVTKHCGQVGGRSSDNLQAIDAIGLVVLRRKSAEVRFLGPVAPFVIESCEMFLGPTKFQLRGGKWMSHRDLWLSPRGHSKRTKPGTRPSITDLTC